MSFPREFLMIALWAALSSVLAVRLARFGLERLGEPPIIGAARLNCISVAGAISGSFFVSYNDQIQWPSLQGIASILLCSLMMSAAFIDHATSWAPRELVIPLSVLAYPASTHIDEANLHTIFACAVFGLLPIGIAKILWAIQTRAERCLVPPADAIALMIPMILFGGGLKSCIYYVLLFFMLVIVRCRPELAWLAGSARRLEAMSRDIWLGQFGSPVSLLAIALPLCVACQAVFSFVE